MRHIVKPDYSVEGTYEPLREHFAGYLSDWEAYAFARTLQKSPWIQPNGRQRYEDDAPIYVKGDFVGYQHIVVIVDTVAFPATIKTAWGDPEDIRNFTGTYYKLTGWGKPDDFDELVLKS